MKDLIGAVKEFNGHQGEKYVTFSDGETVQVRIPVRTGEKVYFVGGRGATVLQIKGEDVIYVQHRLERIEHKMVNQVRKVFKSVTVFTLEGGRIIKLIARA